MVRTVTSSSQVPRNPPPRHTHPRETNKRTRPANPRTPHSTKDNKRNNHLHSNKSSSLPSARNITTENNHNNAQSPLLHPATFFALTTARLASANPDFNAQSAAVEKLSTTLQLYDEPEPYFDDTPTYDVFEVQSYLDDHRNIWHQTVGEKNNYDMEFERVCFCPDNYRGPFVLQVRGGEVESATYTDGSAVDDQLITGLLTVEGVMDEIQIGLDRKYVELRVTYNTMGYPSEFYSDMSKMIADDEMTYKISNVELVD
jgi:hypothetical protein